jgi:hypothetical protein
MIQVERRGENEFRVTVKGATTTQHTVSLDDDYYQRLTGEPISKEELIEKSFRFLLARESNRSILSSFNLKVISNYFPEFEDEIKGVE